ncbi:hypothetical protein MMC13_002579 [Lambiella insularis]|nr:hypothetical protein [Lambiella insularis]
MSMFQFIYEQLFVTPPYPTYDFSGQTAVVTGSNVGLGLEAACHITRLNASKVILAVRSLEKGEKAKASIEQSTGRTGVVEVWPLDLSSYQSVKDFVKRAQSLSRLDVMLENAGIATAKFQLTEGHESTITTNVISTFLLALMILPKMRETASRYNTTPRLTIVSSDVHAWTDLPERASPSIFDKLSDKETADMASRYPVSKLLEVFYVRALAAHMSASSKPAVTLNTLTPGLCHSELGREAGWGLYFMKLLLARSTEVGSRTLVAGSEAGPETHGCYMNHSKVFPPSKFVLSEEGKKTEQRVWEELSKILEKIEPGVMGNI